MGQNESAFRRTYAETVSQLSSVQLGEIAARFNELYAKAGGPKGHLVDREAFSKYFKLPVAVGDRLFDAFDEKKNGKISFEEFVCGLAVLLHGSFEVKCQLLFRVFNIYGDEGISREELTTMLSAIQQSTNTILYTVGEGDSAVMHAESREQAVRRMVDKAFKNCDITRTGKLLPLEFEYWLKRNPKVLDTLLSFNTKDDRCTLGPLLMKATPTTTPTRQPSQPLPRPASYPLIVSHHSQLPNWRSPSLSSQVQSIPESSDQAPDSDLLTSPVVLTREPSSPTLVQMVASDPESVQEEEQEQSSETTHGDSGSHSPTDTVSHSPGDISEIVSHSPGDTSEIVSHSPGEIHEDTSISESQMSPDTSLDVGEVKFTTEPLEGAEESDYTGSIMQSEKEGDMQAKVLELPLPPKVVDMSLVPSSPVLPTTTETVFNVEEKVEEEGGSQPEVEILSLSSNDLELAEQDQLQDSSVLPSSFSESLLDTTTTLPSDSELEEQQTGDVVTVADSKQVTEGFEVEEVAALKSEDALQQEVLSQPADQSERRPSPYPEGENPVKQSLYTAWILSPRAQDLLTQHPAMTTDHLTCPGLIADVRMHDPVGEILSSHFPTSSRKQLLSVEQVSMDAEGLRRLVQDGCFVSALELTGRFLSAHGQGMGQAGQPSMHTHKTLQMWAARIALLVHLHQFKDAELELNAFRELDNPDLFYQYHPHSYPGKTGSLVPFSLRLLHAQIPGYNGNNHLSLDRLCMLQWVCEQVLSGLKQSRLPWVQEPLTAEDQQVAEALWQERLMRVKFSMGNCFVALQDYVMAVAVYEDLLESLPHLTAELYSSIGRLHLQLGDLPTARSYFSRVSSVPTQDSQKLVLIKTNEGLANVFTSKWSVAKECFEAVLQLDPSNIMAQNNRAVCAFFQGSLKEAIDHLETLLPSCLPSSLHPGVFANLSAAYDLESSHSQAKKLAHVPLLAQHVGDSFNMSSLNIR